MPYIVRRVFYAKVGKADPLVTQFAEMNKEASKYGLKSRTLTDYRSGRSDRVVIEWEVKDLKDEENALAKIMADPAGQKKFKEWEAKMNEMIHYSEVETWQVR